MFNQWTHFFPLKFRELGLDKLTIHNTVCEAILLHTSLKKILVSFSCIFHYHPFQPSTDSFNWQANYCIPKWLSNPITAESMSEPYQSDSKLLEYGLFFCLIRFLLWSMPSTQQASIISDNYITVCLAPFQTRAFICAVLMRLKLHWNISPVVNKHIEAETKWTPFCRWHFQMHFLEWKCMNLD